MSKLLDENTANIEKAKSLTAGLSAAQLNWQPQPGKWSIALNLAHLNFGYQYFDTLASSIAAARAKGIIGNGPFRYGWLSSWIMKSQEPPPKRKFKAAKATTPPPDVDAAKALADYLRMTARLGELIQEADGLGPGPSQDSVAFQVDQNAPGRPPDAHDHSRPPPSLACRTSPQRPQFPHSLNAATSATVCPSRSSGPIPSALPALWPLTTGYSVISTP